MTEVSVQHDSGVDVHRAGPRASLETFVHDDGSLVVYELRRKAVKVYSRNDWRWVDVPRLEADG